MKIKHGVLAFILASFVAAPVFAQTTTGANTSISLPTPPRAMTSMPVAETPGVDSTFQGSVAPNATPSTITLPIPPGARGASASPAARQLSEPQSGPTRSGRSSQTHPL